MKWQTTIFIAKFSSNDNGKSFIKYLEAEMNRLSCEKHEDVIYIWGVDKTRTTYLTVKAESLKLLPSLEQLNQDVIKALAHMAYYGVGKRHQIMKAIEKY